MVVGDQRHAPAALPAGRTPGTLCTGSWLGPRAGQDGCGKYRLHRSSNPAPYKFLVKLVYTVVIF